MNQILLAALLPLVIQAQYDTKNNFCDLDTYLHTDNYQVK